MWQSQEAPNGKASVCSEFPSGWACLPHEGLWLMPTTHRRPAEGVLASVIEVQVQEQQRLPRMPVGHSQHWRLTRSLPGQGPPPSWKPPLLQPGPGVHLSYWTWRVGRPQGPRDSWPLSQGHSCDYCLFLGARRSSLLPVALCCLCWPGCCLHLGRRACWDSGGWQPPSRERGPSPRAGLFLETPREHGSCQKGRWHELVQSV